MHSVRRRVTDLTPSNLTRAHQDLMVDASVLINILGTGRSEIILRALDRTVKIDEIALGEVTIDPFTMKSPTVILGNLREMNLIETVSLSKDAYEIFIGLTGSDPPDDLGDGESATLAQAVSCKCTAVIDERKATRIAKTQFPNVVLLNSLDLLAAPEMFETHQREMVAEVIYQALRNARMRVRQTERAWIVALLGNDRASECPSLRLPAGHDVSNPGQHTTIGGAAVT
jgi:predicted nucleic acid-binding protein